MSKRAKRVLGVVVATTATALCVWWFMWGWWPIAWQPGDTIRVVTEG